MPYAAYPSAGDLSAMLTDVKVSVPAPTRLNALVAQAATQFELRTGWVPFLAGGAVTRNFDPPTGTVGLDTLYGQLRGRMPKLILDQGLMSLTSLSVNGVTKTLGTDFWLYPANSNPKQWVEFRCATAGPLQSIAVNGTWGRVTAVPEDAWLAILRLAGLQCLAEEALKVTGGTQSWSEGDASEVYGVNPYASTTKAWNDYIDQVVGAYKRVTGYL